MTPSAVLSQALLSLVASRCAGGMLRIYTAPRPASPDDVVGSAVLLSEHAIGSPAWSSIVGHTASGAAISADSGANNSGVPAWGRIYRADGGVEGDISVAPAGGSAELVISAASIPAGSKVTIASLAVAL